MKKLIPLIAIALAMVAPAVMLATDYNAYYNPDKDILIEWVETAINLDYISFGDSTCETLFMYLCDDLYDEVAAQDWEGCVTVAGYLETAAQYIDGSAIRSYVISICQTTQAIFGYTDPIGMTDDTEGYIQASLARSNSRDMEVTEYEAHCADCSTFGPAHLKDCSIIREVKEQAGS